MAKPKTDSESNMRLTHEQTQRRKQGQVPSGIMKRTTNRDREHEPHFKTKLRTGRWPSRRSRVVWTEERVGDVEEELRKQEDERVEGNAAAKGDGEGERQRPRRFLMVGAGLEKPTRQPRGPDGSRGFEPRRARESNGIEEAKE